MANDGNGFWLNQFLWCYLFGLLRWPPIQMVMVMTMPMMVVVGGDGDVDNNPTTNTIITKSKCPFGLVASANTHTQSFAWPSKRPLVLFVHTLRIIYVICLCIQSQLANIHPIWHVAYKSGGHNTGPGGPLCGQQMLELHILQKKTLPTHTPTPRPMLVFFLWSGTSFGSYLCNHN